jgi:hypothetical protein
VPRSMRAAPTAVGATATYDRGDRAGRARLAAGAPADLLGRPADGCDRRLEGVRVLLRGVATLRAAAPSVSTMRSAAATRPSQARGCVDEARSRPMRVLRDHGGPFRLRSTSVRMPSTSSASTR